MEKNLIQVGYGIYITKEKLMDLYHEHCSNEDGSNRTIRCKDLKLTITELLVNLGGRESLSGFTYAVEALNLLLTNPQLHVCELYNKTADVCGSTLCKVERALRHFILTLRKDHTSLYETIFGQKQYNVGDFIWKLKTHINIHILNNEEE